MMLLRQSLAGGNWILVVVGMASKNAIKDNFKLCWTKKELMQGVVVNNLKKGIAVDIVIWLRAMVLR